MDCRAALAVTKDFSLALTGDATRTDGGATRSDGHFEHAAQAALRTCTAAAWLEK